MASLDIKGFALEVGAFFFRSKTLERNALTPRTGRQNPQRAGERLLEKVNRLGEKRLRCLREISVPNHQSKEGAGRYNDGPGG